MLCKTASIFSYLVTTSTNKCIFLSIKVQECEFWTLTSVGYSLDYTDFSQLYSMWVIGLNGTITCPNIAQFAKKKILIHLIATLMYTEVHNYHNRDCKQIQFSYIHMSNYKHLFNYRIYMYVFICNINILHNSEHY